MKTREDEPCRLCLKTFCDQNYEEMGEITKEILDVLLLKVNLDITKESAMCSSCAENLEKSFEFKATCLYTEDYIVPFLSSKKETKLDLRKVYMNQKKNLRSVDISRDQKICRLCLDLVTSECFTSLSEIKNDMLKKHMPELAFGLTKNPVVCASCIDSLKKYFALIETCLNTEEQITKYCQIKRNGSRGQITLSRVVQFTQKGDHRDNINTLKKQEDRQDMESSKNEQVGVRSKESNRLLNTVSLKKLEKGVKFCGKRNGVNKVNDPPDLKLYRCKSCAFQTKHRGNLSKHMLIHKDPSEIRWFKCELCPYKSKRKSHLTRHLETHKKEKVVKTSYKCDKCVYQTYVRGNFQKHKEVHADPTTLKMYSCKICAFKTRIKYDVKAHMRKHTNKKLKCEICTFKTKYSESLTRHMIIHKSSSELKTYKCDICEFEAIYKIQLSRHIILTHMDTSKIVMYKCEKCEYSSPLKLYVTSHMRRHNKERP